MAIGLATYQMLKRVRDKAVTLLLKSGFHSFGPRSVITLPFRSGGEKAISIGERVFIGHHSWFEVMGNRDGSHPVIRIEDDVSFSGFCTITAVSDVFIGRGALIARFVHISDHSHQTSDPELPIKDQGITKVAPVKIGPGAWLGHGVIVCPGVTIGRNAVIGANSVVREDVPDFCVAAGAPARIIRRPAVEMSLAKA